MANGWSFESLSNHHTRYLFETYVHPDAISDASNLRKDYIRIIKEEEERNFKNGVIGKKFGIILDGTSRVGEWYVYCIRYVDNKGFIKQYPILHRYDHGMTEISENANELSSCVIKVAETLCQTNEGYQKQNCVALCADRVKVNRSALKGEHIKYSLPGSIYLDCMSHTLHHCGEAVSDACTNCDMFFKLHNGVFSRSNKAASTWLNTIGISMPTASGTRWFSERKVLKYIFHNWNDYVQFYTNGEYGETSSKDSQFHKMRQLICPQFFPSNRTEKDCSNQLYYIRLEMAIIIDCTRMYNRVCYNLEGDGAIAPLVFEELDANILKHITSATPPVSFPTTWSIVEKQSLNIDSGGRSIFKSEQSDYILKKFNAGAQYYCDHFLSVPSDANSNCFGHLLSMYESMSLANPCFMRRTVAIIGRNCEKGDHFECDLHHALVRYVDEQLGVLVKMKRITLKLKQELIDEIGLYRHASESCVWDQIRSFSNRVENIEEFWRANITRCPRWYEFACICFLHQPSSAAAERVFSVLNRMFNDLNEHSIDDVIQARVYLAYS